MPPMNPQQKKAVTHSSGPLLIVAGAGTGKTFVLVEKITHLIKKKLARPEEILALTFTEKAALEMEERVDRALPYGYFQMWISTFHSFADQILKDELSHIGLNPGYTLLTQAQSILFMKKHLYEFKLRYFRPFGNPTKFIAAMHQHFSRLRDEFVSPAEYEGWAQSLQPGEAYSQEEVEKYQELARAYRVHEEVKVREGVFDFGDLMYYLIVLFQKRPSIREQYQRQFKYVLVDEFQDTNIAQYHLIKELCPPDSHPNLTVVGDDSQAIYKFRGASLSNILTFMKDYPDAAQVTLNQNYRSYQHILDMSHRLIKHNEPDTLEHRLGISKQLSAQRKEKTGEILFTIHEKVDMEAEYVAREVVRMRQEEKRRFGDCALLVRANNHAEPFLTAFTRHGIPYRFIGPGALFKQPEVKDLIAYLKLLYDVGDSMAFYRVLGMSLFAVDGKDLASLVSFARKTALSLFEAADVHDKLTLGDLLPEEQQEYEQYKPHLPLFTEFSKQSLHDIMSMVKRHLDRIQKNSAGEILFFFLEDTGYLTKLQQNPSEKNEKILENVGKFFTKLKSFEIENIDATVQAVVEYIDLSVEMGESPQATEIDTAEYDAVSVLTVHSSKGLEFPVVFLPNLTKGRFPTTEKREKLPIPTELVKEELPEGNYHLQEERRLFYVGLTRAQDKVYLSASKFYTGGKRERRLSPFVAETVGEETVNSTMMIREEEKQQLSIFDFKTTEEPEPQMRRKLTTFSYSQLETFQRCPLQYKYQYILKVPTQPTSPLSFGETVHLALQNFYSAYQTNNGVGVEDLLSLYEQAWIPVGYTSQEEVQEKKEAGKEMLRRYFSTFHHNHLHVIGVEKLFKIKVDTGTYLTGKMDRVDAMGDGVIEIVDYKTGSKPDEKKLKKDLQLRIYALAAADEGLYGKKPEEIMVSFYYLQDMEKISRRFTKEELMETKGKVLEIIEEIRTSTFPGCGLAWCNVCSSVVV